MKRPYFYPLIVIFIIVLFLLPFRKVVRNIFLFPADLLNQVIYGRGDKEKKLLEREIRKLELKNLIYQAKIKDLERLFQYKSVPAEMKIARVIARSPEDWSKVLFIDKGKAEGISPMLPVMLTQGIVGRTLEVGPDYSSVLLAIDPGSKIAALSGQTREPGIIQGTGSNLLMKFFSSRVNARPGEDILTSGLGGIFPKELPLGKIREIKEGGLYAEAIVSPGVDFLRLEEVFVLTR